MAEPSPSEIPVIISVSEHGHLLKKLSELGPPAFLPVAGVPLIRRLVDIFTDAGFENITVIDKETSHYTTSGIFGDLGDKIKITVTDKTEKRSADNVPGGIIFCSTEFFPDKRMIGELLDKAAEHGYKQSVFFLKDKNLHDPTHPLPFCFITEKDIPGDYSTITNAVEFNEFYKSIGTKIDIPYSRAESSYKERSAQPVETVKDYMDLTFGYLVPGIPEFEGEFPTIIEPVNSEDVIETGDSVLIGPNVYLGKNCRLDALAEVSYSILLGDNVLGRECILENTVVMEGVTIPEGAKIRNGIVKKNDKDDGDSEYTVTPITN